MNDITLTAEELEKLFDEEKLAIWVENRDEVKLIPADRFFNMYGTPLSAFLFGALDNDCYYPATVAKKDGLFSTLDFEKELSVSVTELLHGYVGPKAHMSADELNYILNAS